MKRRPTLLATLIGLLILTGCVPNPSGDTAVVIAVESSDDACTVSPAGATDGAVTFRVANTGASATEFYLLADDSVSIVAEVEDIAPGTSRDLTVDLTVGGYVTVCKPGMIGSGIGEASFTVTVE